MKIPNISWLAFILDLSILTEILLSQGMHELFNTATITLPLIFGIVITVKVVLSMQQITNTSVFVSSAFVIEIIIVWLGALNFGGRVSPNGIIICQLLVKCDTQFTVRHVATMVLLISAINSVQVGQTPLFSYISITEYCQVILGILYCLFAFKHKPDRTKCIIIEPKLNTRSQIPLIQEITSTEVPVGSTTRQRVQQDVQLLLSNFQWLKDEQIIVISSQMSQLYSTLQFETLIRESVNRSSQIDELDTLLLSQIKSWSKPRESFMNQVNYGNTNLRELLHFLGNQDNFVNSFVSIQLNNPQLDISNYIVNIFGIQQDQQAVHIIHFQKSPEVLEHNHQILIDICKSLSHELSTCLNCIVALSGAALDNDAIDCQIKQDYFNPIRISSDQLNLIVSNIRDYNSIEIDQFELKLSEINIVQECKIMISHFSQTCSARNIQLLVPEGQHIVNVYNDQDRLRQVLYQLLSNAVRFTQNGKITLSYELNDDEVYLSISDTGIGMTINEQRKLSNLLQKQELQRVSENSVGSGLGLYIANKIVKKLSYNENSQIQFHSVPSVGTHFWFYMKNLNQTYNNSFRQPIYGQNSIIKLERLGSYIENIDMVKSEKVMDKPPFFNQFMSLAKPQETPKDEKMSLQSIKSDKKLKNHIYKLSIQPHKFMPIQSAPQLRGNCCAKVLVVDDEFYNIKSLQTVMKKFRTTCDSAFNGQEGMDRIYHKLSNPCQTCSNRFYKLIFLDINMPIMGGIEMVLEIKEMMNSGQIEKVWCVANTGFSDVATKIAAYEAGMDFFLTKPLSTSKVYTVINQVFPDG